MTKEYCPTCNEKYKYGAFKTNQPIPDFTNKVINLYQEEKLDARCTKCASNLYNESLSKLKNEFSALNQSIIDGCGMFPVASIHSPQGWNYTVKKLVTAQSTTGTGVLSEITASFTDFFGTQSGAFNQKIKSGENLCLQMLAKQALDCGGNAIIGLDIDYAELGGSRGMLMVCMTGTCVHLKNVDILDEATITALEATTKCIQRIQELEVYKPALTF